MHSFSSTWNPSMRRGLDCAALTDFKLVRFFIVIPPFGQTPSAMTSIAAPNVAAGGG
jgi:hypothetical protein